MFAANEDTSGLARALGMAAIILLSDGDAELGGRVAGATYRMVREKGVMLAPVKVLHLPDPAGLATERFGADRTAELLAEGRHDDRGAVAAVAGRAGSGSGPGGDPGEVTRDQLLGLVAADPRHDLQTARRGDGCWASWRTVPAAPSTGSGTAKTSAATSHSRSAPTHIGHGSRVVKIVASARCGVAELAGGLAEGDDDGVRRGVVRLRAPGRGRGRPSPRS